MSLAKKLTTCALALCVAVVLPSCDSGITAPRLNTGTDARQQSIRLEKTELQLIPGETVRIGAQVVSWSGEMVTGQTISWSSSAPGVASVSGEGTVAALRTGDATITATSGQATATAKVRVSGRVIAALLVSPKEDTLNTGATLLLNATAVDPAGSPVADAGVSWASLDTDVATVSAAGQVTSHGPGIARITAEAGGRSDTVRVHVRGGKASLRLKPGSAELAAIGDTVRLSADVQDAAGNPVHPSAVKWTALDPAVATVDGAGLVTARGTGVARVAAEHGGKADTAKVEVKQRVVTVSVTPVAPVVQAGQTQRLVATARDANGYEVPGVAFQWMSSNTAAAAVDGAGMVRAVAPGVSYVTASTGGKSGTATVTVTADPGMVISRVAVAPRADTLDALGETAQLGVTVHNAAGGTIPGAAVSWTSLDAGIVTVDGAGKVTAKAVGTARIVAVAGGLSDTAKVLVRQVVASVTVSPSAPVVQAGKTQQLDASASDANGHPVPGVVFGWASSNPRVATVDGAGLVKAVEAGVSYVTASAGGKTATATLTVTAAPVVQAPVATVSVSPPSATVVVGGTVSLAATARDAAGSTLAGRAVTWTTSDAAVAKVSAAGVVTGVAAGSATITATVEGKTGTAAVTVSADPATVPARVAVAPGADTLDALGATAQLGATVYSAAGAAIPGAKVSWASLDAGVATVDGAGKVTAKAAGTARIVATSGGLGDTARVLVRQVVASVSVSPSAPTVQAGQTQALAASARDANGNAISGVAFAWSSSNTAAATVDGSGVVRGVAAGVSYVTASAGGKSAVATVTVAAPSVAKVVVSPGSASLDVGRTVSLSASALDAAGNPLTGRAVSWSTSSAAVATVSPSGVVTGVSAGSATITATVEGKTGSAQVVVSAPVTGPALAFQDDFEGSRFAAAQNGISWGGSMNVKLSSVRSRSGSYALRGVYPATLPKNPPNVQQSLNLPGLREFWVEYYVHIPENFTMQDVDGSDNKKWFLVKDADLGGAANSVAVYFEYDTTPDQAPGARLLVKWEVDEGQPEYAYKTTSVNGFLTPAHRGKWVQFRAHIKLANTRTGSGNTATGDGVVQVWRDGQLLYENLRAPLKAVNPTMAARNQLGHGYFLGAANNGFPQETVYDVDDFKMYVANPGW